MKEAIIQYNNDPDADGNHMVISWKKLVRCRDCKHWMPPGTGYENAVLGQCLGRDHGLKKSDWFCADGERRADDA